jgi:hypothetical protein
VDRGGVEPLTFRFQAAQPGEGVLMVTRTGRIATLLLLLIAGALLSVGCTDGTKEKTDKASPATSRTPISDLTPTSTGIDRGALTRQELLWLDAAEQLLPKMNEAFDAVPAYINTPAALPAALRSLASQVRGCSRDLARLGSASARLRLVEALVRQGCREFDKGAKCLEEAARLGSSTSSPQARRREQLVACGYAAAEAGRKPLAEAQIKAYEVRAAATGSR